MDPAPQQPASGPRTAPRPGPAPEAAPARPGSPGAPAPRAQVLEVVDAVLETVRSVLGCELAALNVLAPSTVLVARTQGHLPGLTPGTRSRRADTLCHLLLADDGRAARDVGRDPGFGDVPAVRDLGLRSYAGVPVRDRDDVVVGTLCGFDRRPLEVDDRALAVLEGLAAVLTPHADAVAQLDARIVRAGGTWLVEGVEPEGTGTALAALLADGVEPPPVDEHAWLVANVAALEEGTQSRVALEQAVGRVAERLHVPPVEAYRALRAEAGGSAVDSRLLAAVAPRVRPAG